MSFPKHTPSPLSSSPSKQSSRGNAGAQPSRPWAIERASTHQQQREQYDTTPDQQQFHGQQQTEEGFTPHDHAERRQSLESSPHPQFRPFFTLIEDANSSDYHHPTVHYIFSDDDTDLVTEAALRALEADHGTSLPTGKGTSRWRQAAQEQQDEEPYGEEDELEGRQSGPRKTSSLPPPIPGVREHYIILDMEPSNPEPQGADTSTAPATAAPGGTTSLSTSPVAQHHQPNQPQTHPHPHPPSLPFTITSAHSLTPSWQVLDTQLTTAPTFDNNTTNGEHPGSGSLMLKIKGTAGLPRDKIVRDRDGQTLEEMMEQFERRMDELRRVIEVGGHVPAGGPEPETREGAEEEGAETAAGAERQQRKAAEDVGPDEVGMEQTDTHYEQEEGGQATTGPDEHEDETTQREGAWNPKAGPGVID